MSNPREGAAQIGRVGVDFFPIVKDWSPNSVDKGQGLETSRNILQHQPETARTFHI